MKGVLTLFLMEVDLTKNLNDIGEDEELLDIYFHENGHAEIVNRRGSLFSQDLNRTDAATISLPSQKNRKAPAQGGATPKHLE